MMDEFEMFSLKGEPNDFTDEAYNLFCEKYIVLSKKRDMSLSTYLKQTPNLFRTHIPPSKWTIAFSFQVVWYYDELVICDPVLQHIKAEKENIEQKKYDLQHLLSYLKLCEDSIKGGYILFAGDSLFPSKTGVFDDESKILADIPEILKAFEKESLIIKRQSPINNNIKDNLTQIECIYEGLWGNTRQIGMFIPPHLLKSNKLSDGIFYDFLAPYETLTMEEFLTFKMENIFDGLKKEFRKDIAVDLEAMSNAQRFNIPMLFHRDVDSIIAQNYSMNNSASSQTVYNCMLPYLENIPAERLFDIRSQIPEAFKEFRAFLFELVEKTTNSYEGNELINFKIDKEITSLMRKLTTELANAKRKWVFKGLTTPIVMLTGSMGLFSSGIDYSQLFSTILGSGGVIQGIKTWSDSKSEERITSLNPAYFLWKAQQ